MSTLNTSDSSLSDRLNELGIRIPNVLLPKKGIELKTWSVVACDQYTSDQEYWNRVDALVGKAPSTLRITLPEIYLESPDVEARIESIHSMMKSYLEQGILSENGEAIIYIERRTQPSGLRQGLLFAMDLERYDYARDSQTLIRATEGTIVERIPPRLRVRKEASIEIPHIMILINDPEKRLIENTAANLQSKERLYDVTLMEHGGSLCGWAIRDADSISEIVNIFSDLLAEAKNVQNTDSPLFFAMGDGNHSLATAKAHWEAQKGILRAAGHSESEIMNHPARFALAEIVNIHSPGLRFEPIHRAIFCLDTNALSEFIKKHPLIKSVTPAAENDVRALLSSAEGQTKAAIYDGNNYFVLDFVDPSGKLPPAIIDEIYNSWNCSKEIKARIDFIHGWEDNKKLTKEGAVACFVPVIARERLFQWVAQNGPLPRKAFSMGDAEEKKYYMECRRIR
ncbi:MAG: DUF1015 domain-containing protein [Fibrobacter sp.]|nr:DUF1015 domain-containing protein [Fibrobacter sp.]